MEIIWYEKRRSEISGRRIIKDVYGKCYRGNGQWSAPSYLSSKLLAVWRISSLVFPLVALVCVVRDCKNWKIYQTCRCVLFRNYSLSRFCWRFMTGKMKSMQIKQSHKMKYILLVKEIKFKLNLMKLFKWNVFFIYIFI